MDGIGFYIILKDTIGLDNHANHVNQSLEDITNVLHIGEQTHYNVIQVILKLISTYLYLNFSICVAMPNGCTSYSLNSQ
jgi:hypothetical protein